jgi:subtilisin family serine protease
MGFARWSCRWKISAYGAFVPSLRALLTLAALATALAATSPAHAVDLAQRPSYLPPPDGWEAGSVRLPASAGRRDDLIVAVERGARPRAILRMHRARELANGFWLVEAGETMSALRRLEAIGALRYSHPNGRAAPARTQATQGDPSDPAPWWVPRIGADRVTPPAGPGFPITVIDDGIDATHPEFALRPVTYLNANAVTPPDDYHGTMVTSVAAAPVNGVGIAGLYPNADVRFADDGTGTCGETLAALGAAIDAGPSVINMSWGFSQPASCFALYDLLIQAFGSGSLPVAAAGNEREAGSPPGVPAILPHVLTVGASSPADQVAFFSNRHDAVDLAAPGEGIMLATPTFYDASGYAIESGTSFSAPMVSAAASWVATQRPGMDVTQLFDLLRWETRDIGAPDWDPDTGFGLLNLPDALARPLPSVDPQEPNDDINQVKVRGLFRNATPPLTRPGRGRASLGARLDFTEDPVDVYRVFVPAKRVVHLTVKPNADVDLEVFRPLARTVYYQNRRAALRGALIGGSRRSGKAVERFEVRNSGRHGIYVYAVAYISGEVDLSADYGLTIRTRLK